MFPLRSFVQRLSEVLLDDERVPGKAYGSRLPKRGRLEPVGWRSFAMEVREQLRNLQELVDAIVKDSGITPTGLVHPLHDLLEAYQETRGELAETQEHASVSYERERQLRALVERWQGYAEDMLKQRDDFARLHLSEQHKTDTLRQTCEHIGDRLESETHRADAGWLHARVLAQTAAAHVLFSKRLGDPETGRLGVSLEVKVENGRLVVQAWRRIGSSLRGWLRAF